MHRRFGPLLFALLIALPGVAPVTAAEPTASSSIEPSAAPGATPVTVPTATSGSPTVPDAGAAPVDDPTGATTAPGGTAAPPRTPVIPDATGRYIVMLRSGSDTAAVEAKAGKRDGVKADHSFGRVVRGFSAKLDKVQKRALLADPSVVAVVPDEVIQLTQTVPTGVMRVGGQLNPVAKIDGTDERVDADVAIVDTGISAHPDLNVAGGHNCSTADPTAWRDKNNHGTHVAGIVAALDNGIGVVGVAPGARVWGVKILNDDGYGLISWYVCGLDWILAQRDPNDATRPLFEAVNMSVTKTGSDDHNCGLTNHDALHQAICRVVAGGITVVAAAANDHHNAAANIPASYDEVITVSALADTDGLPGGLGGNRCLSWGTYDQDDTFADFSNFGADVDLIAPGKCIMSTVPGGGYMYMSGTSMAAPTVTGAVALYKSSRPNATPAEVREALRYLGNQNWKTWTDPDGTHEPLLDVSRIGVLGTFALSPGSGTRPTIEGGATSLIPVTVARSATFFERVTLQATSLPDGWTTSAAPSSVMGWSAASGLVSVTPPKDEAPGQYQVGITGTNQGRTSTTTITVNVVENNPTAFAPVVTIRSTTKMMLNAVYVDVAWPAATDPSSPISGYELQRSVAGGAWAPAIAFAPTQRGTTVLVGFDTSNRFRIRAQDSGGHWSPWATSASATVIHPVDDRSTAISRSSGWSRPSDTSAFRQTVTGTSRPGATLSLQFTGHGIAVVGSRGPTRGAAKVYIDGTYVATIWMWSATASSRQLWFTRSFASVGTHRITLRVLGGGPHPNFRLDAFVISR